MPPSLRTVPNAPAETARERAARLAEDARHAAMEILGTVVLAAEAVIAETADLPEAIPAGLRDELRRMGEEMERHLKTIEAIRVRK